MEQRWKKKRKYLEKGYGWQSGSLTGFPFTLFHTLPVKCTIYWLA
jgi:hypothetical protein